VGNLAHLKGFLTAGLAHGRPWQAIAILEVVETCPQKMKLM